MDMVQEHITVKEYYNLRRVMMISTTSIVHSGGPGFNHLSGQVFCIVIQIMYIWVKERKHKSEKINDYGSSFQTLFSILKIN